MVRGFCEAQDDDFLPGLAVDVLGEKLPTQTDRWISISLKLEMDPWLPHVHADRDRLMQVIVNLISNAVKFCDDAKGEVSILAGQMGGRLFIGVLDNGPGVPKNDRQLIFEKFQEASEPQADRPRGTGLGLAISRQIVEHFGGRIWVEDAPDGGAAFCLTMPVSREPVEAVPGRQSQEAL